MQDEDIRQHTAMDYKKRVCQAMNFISQNLDRNLSIEEIAQASSFSAFHFHRIFKAVTGETVAGFTRRLRLEMAANRLLSSYHGDIATIAMDYGFSSSQNFAKAFRQHFQMSPTEYRKSKNGNKISRKENVLSLQAKYTDTVFMNQLNHERRNTMNAEVREMPGYTVAYVRKVGPYNRETCEPAFAEVLQWAGPRNYVGPGKIMAIYWDNPDVTPPEKCRFDACVIVPEGVIPGGQVNIQTINGGSYAVCRFELKRDGFHQAWDDAFKWVCDSGYECNDTPFYDYTTTMLQNIQKGSG